MAIHPSVYWQSVYLLDCSLFTKIAPQLSLPFFLSLSRASRPLVCAVKPVGRTTATLCLCALFGRPFAASSDSSLSTRQTSSFPPLVATFPLSFSVIAAMALTGRAPARPDNCLLASGKHLFVNKAALSVGLDRYPSVRPFVLMVRLDVRSHEPISKYNFLFDCYAKCYLCLKCRST